MTTEERFTRIENILDRLADRQEQQDETLATLTESSIKLTEAQTTLTEAQTRLAEAQAKTDTQLKALGIAIESLERQWQAYLTTISPQ